MQFKRFILFTEPVDGKIEDDKVQISNVEVILQKVSISDLGKESFISKFVVSVKPDMIFLSTSYGDFVNHIAKMLYRISSETISILFGSLIYDCIFPPLKWDISKSNFIDYVITSNTCFGLKEYFSCFMNDSLSKQDRTIILNLHDKSKLISLNEPIDMTLPKIIPEISHLPFHLSDAIREIKLNKFINKRIQDRFYEDKFIVVAALPKSASSIIGSCISVIHSKGFDRRDYGRYMQKNDDSDLRPEIVKDFPLGGLVKYHTSPTSKNLKVLMNLGVKYVILIREPIDQITAIFTHYLYNNHGSNEIIFDHIYPLNREKLYKNDHDETLRYLIQDGYLFKILSWIVDWLTFRDNKKSIIITYESFIEQRKETIDLLSKFFHGNGADDNVSIKCNSIADDYKTKRERSIKLNEQSYPHGWSGKIGIWKDYFSEENIARYNRVVRNFLESYPNASLLYNSYPNILKTNI